MVTKTVKVKASNNGVGTITEIRGAIVDAQVKGEDTTELVKKLKRARLDAAAEAEVVELRKVADKRLEVRQKAKKARGKVKLQGEAIDHFLEVRDNITAPLKELIELADSVDLVKAQLDCYAGYNDIGAFSWSARSVPKGYLPDNFACPFLGVVGGQMDAHDTAAESLYYLKMAYGILASLERTEHVASPFQHTVDEGL